MTLRKKLMLSFLILVLLMGSMIGYFSYQNAKNLVLENKEQEMADTINRIDISINSQVQQINRLAENVKSSQIVRAYLKKEIHTQEETEELNDWMEGLLNLISSCTDLILMNEDGTVYYSYSGCQAVNDKRRMEVYENAASNLVGDGTWTEKGSSLCQKNGLGFKGLFISFLLFWAMNVYIAGSGSSALQKLEKFAAPVLIVLSFIVIIWGIRSADWSVSKLLSDPSLQGDPSKNFWTLFFPALSSMIAFDGGIALSMADFTKNCKTQKAQAVGQLVGAPVMTAFISFVGICGTAGAAIVFKEAIWEPAVLVSKFDNPFIVIIFSLFIIMAVLTTNVAANLVPPTNVIATLFAKKVSYKKAALIAAVLALFAQPWNALASAYDLIYNVCGMLGALLGPISGLYLVSYLFEHKTEVDMVDMYKEDGGKYYYSKGFNVPIIIIFVAAMIIIFAGKYIAPLKFIFDNAYVVGSIGAGLAYFIYIKAAKRG